MKYTENVKVPMNCTVLDEEEMCYIEGGINIGMCKEYLKKDYCLSVAKYFKQQYSLNKVSQSELAKEIYGHAYGYYNMTKAVILLGGALTSLGWMLTVYPHLKDGVDIENKTDRFQWAWNTIWKLS